MTATPSDRDILYDIVTNGRWSEGEQRGEWMITKEVYETARDALLWKTDTRTLANLNTHGQWTNPTTSVTPTEWV